MMSLKVFNDHRSLSRADCDEFADIIGQNLPPMMP